MSQYCPIINDIVLYPECVECKTKLCKKDAFFCLVVGSRTFNDYTLLKEKLDYFLQNKNEIVIVSGGARGADTLAKRYAKEKGFFYQEFLADWKRFGKKAGYIRNRKMHEYIAKQKECGVVAFWDRQSKGTVWNFKLAKEFSNQLKIVCFSLNKKEEK